MKFFLQKTWSLEQQPTTMVEETFSLLQNNKNLVFQFISELIPTARLAHLARHLARKLFFYLVLSMTVLKFLSFLQL